jgi:uncharacterized protein
LLPAGARVTTQGGVWFAGVCGFLNSLEVLAMAVKFELKKTTNDKFMFHLLTVNGQVILTSEAYDSRASALQGIESVKKHAPDDARYGRLCARNGEPYFTLKAGNGQVLAQSQRYSGAKARDAGIEVVQSHALGADLHDLTAP